MTWLDPFRYRDFLTMRPHIYKSKILFGHWVCAKTFTKSAVGPTALEAYTSWVKLNYESPHKKV